MGPAPAVFAAERSPAETLQMLSCRAESALLDFLAAEARAQLLGTPRSTDPFLLASFLSRTSLTTSPAKYSELAPFEREHSLAAQLVRARFPPQAVVANGLRRPRPIETDWR